MSRYRTFARVDVIRKIAVMFVIQILFKFLCQIKFLFKIIYIYVCIYFDEEWYSIKDRYLFYGIICSYERDRTCIQTVYFAKGIVSMKDIITEHVSMVYRAYVMLEVSGVIYCK